MAFVTKNGYWEPPNPGWFKLNTDGSSLGNPGQSSYGGIIRNDRGGWVCGYMGNIGFDTSLAAEIRGIMMGLRLVRVMGLNNVIIETDCQAAVLLITVKGVDESSPLSWMIKSCRKDMADIKCYMVHAKRNKNRCADAMARLGGRQGEEFIVFDNPPEKLIPLVMEDAYAAGLGSQLLRPRPCVVVLPQNAPTFLSIGPKESQLPTSVLKPNFATGEVYPGVLGFFLPPKRPTTFGLRFIPTIL